MSGNSTTTTRVGAQSPSSSFMAPPRTRKRPPYASTAGPAASRYAAYCSGSVTSESTITYAGMRGLYASAMESETSSPEETEALAGRLAARLRAGDVVTVSGELGSGKTTFVRGACRELGVTAHVTSPTFTIGHRYPGDPDVSHLDLFRFQGVSAAEWGDLESYFEDAICFVEWPEAAAGALPPVRVEVRLSHVDPTNRLIMLESAEKALLDGLFGGADSRF